jgi:5-methyltetrahydrofolate--homocysteine methyltransferase
MGELEKVKELLIQGDRQQTPEGIKQALANNQNAEDILYKALVPGMSEVGEKMSRGEYFIPEVLLCAQVMQTGINILQPHLGDKGSTSKAGTVVMGTVYGDIHDIGKNLVIILLEASQFKVINLGVNVPVDKFIEAAKVEKPDVIGMSAMLTTTRQEMTKVIEGLREAGLRESIKIMIGGAPISQDWADKIGADAYGNDCAIAVEMAKEFVAQKRG